MCEGDGHWPKTPGKLQKDINFKLELDFRQGFSHWEAVYGKNALRK
jgi:hypothetical protein